MDFAPERASLAAMNRHQPSFWKQPRGMVVLGVGGVLLLATAWIGFSRLGPSPSSGEAFAPARRIDENALVAANAERAGAAAAPAPAASAVEASAEDSPANAAAPTAPAAKPGQSEFNPNEIIGEAVAAIEDARQGVEDAFGDDEGDKPQAQ